MRLHAQLHKGVFPSPKPGEIGHRSKSEVGHNGREHGAQKRHKRLHDAARSHHPDACQSAGEHGQSEVRPPDCPEVQVPFRTSQHADHQHKRQGGQQGCKGHHPRAQEFGQHHLTFRQGSSQQQLKRPCTMLLCKRPHGNGGNEEHQHPWRHREERVERRHPNVQKVPPSWEQPQEQTGEQKEDRHHGVPEERAEKTLNFFEDEGSHESKAKDSLYVGSTTS